MMKVLLHVNQVDCWTMALGNAKNLLAYLDERGEQAEIEIVANGQSVVGLLKTEPEWKDLMMEVMARNVVIAACNNSLQKMQIKVTDMLDGVQVVPAGIAEIIIKQQEGYAYIKP